MPTPSERVLPVGLGIFPKGLPRQVLVRLRLRGDALRPAGPRPDKLRAGQNRLTFVQFSLQFLNLVLPVRQTPLQVPYPLLFKQQDLGEVFVQVAHVEFGVKLFAIIPRREKKKKPQPNPGQLPALAGVEKQISRRLER